MPQIHRRRSRGRRAFAIPLARICAAAWLAVTTLAMPGLKAADEPPEIARRRAAERRSFSDAEIVEGFFKLTLAAEFRIGGRVDRIRKYDRPVRVFIDSRAQPDRSAQIAAVIDDIAAKIRHLDIATTARRKDANFIVTLVRDRDLARAIRSLFGTDRARRIQRSLEPQCLSGFRKDSTYRILHSDVIIVVDAGDLVFYDCAYEEILQALGPINDDPTVPWSMFNDDVQMGFFGLYDQYLLNILYHPRVQPGMTRSEVEALLPEILPAVRAWVAKTNGLPP
jgi:hypothetical protein